MLTYCCSKNGEVIRGIGFSADDLQTLIDGGAVQVGEDPVSGIPALVIMVRPTDDDVREEVGRLVEEYDGQGSLAQAVAEG